MHREGLLVRRTLTDLNGQVGNHHLVIVDEVAMPVHPEEEEDMVHEETLAQAQEEAMVLAPALARATAEVACHLIGGEVHRRV